METHKGSHRPLETGFHFFCGFFNVVQFFEQSSRLFVTFLEELSFVVRRVRIDNVLLDTEWVFAEIIHLHVLCILLILHSGSPSEFVLPGIGLLG